MTSFLRGILHILDQKERARLYLLCVLDVIISALDIAFLGTMVLIINFYISNARLPYMFFLPASLADQNSVLLVAIFFVLFGIKNVIAYWVSAAEYRFIYSVASRLSKRNIYHYLSADYLKYVNIDSSTHIYKITQQPIEFSTYILTNLQQIVTQSVLVLFTVIAILIYHASLFLLLFLLLTPAVAVLGWILKSRLKQIRQNIKRTSTETLKTLKEALAGYVESNIYNKDEFFVDRYIRQQEQLNHNIQTQQMLQSLPSRLIEIFAVFGFFILIVINKWSAHGTAIDLLTIGVFVAAAYKIIPGIVKMLNSAGQMKTYEFVLNDLAAIDAGKKAMSNNEERIKSIRLDKIHFSYNCQPVLAGVDLEVNSGDFVGISSDSGRGKTTLIHLLLGFIDQSEGTVSFNGHIQRAAGRQNYWGRISYIKQQPFLIHDTIARNIALQEDGFDQKKLSDIIAFCGLDGLLDQYPEGGNFLVTENGKNISGGQRQRLMLARALYHDFDLLILDEPFGELDQESENLILENLQQIAAHGKMILFITHNKSSLAYCNKIVSFDEQA